MSTKELGLTGLALTLLAFWEAAIGEIPFGLFTIHAESQPLLFTSLMIAQLLLAALWLAMASKRWSEQHQQQTKRKETAFHSTH